MNPKETKSFLDTSVLRSLLTGERTYRRHLSDRFTDENSFVSRFVRMEFMRGFILVAANLFFDLDHAPNAAKVLHLWSNKFQNREVKILVKIVALSSENWGFDLGANADKESIQKLLANQIRTLVGRARFEFKDPGHNGSDCRRGLIFPDYDSHETQREALEDFVERFLEIEILASQCDAVDFLTKRQRKALESLTELTQKKVTGLVKEVKGVLGGGPCGCKRCERMGDVIIALEAPRTMALMHTDQSFDFLCDQLGIPHEKIVSELAFLKAQ